MKRKIAGIVTCLWLSVLTGCISPVETDDINEKSNTETNSNSERAVSSTVKEAVVVQNGVYELRRDGSLFFSRNGGAKTRVRYELDEVRSIYSIAPARYGSEEIVIIFHNSVDSLPLGKPENRYEVYVAGTPAPEMTNTNSEIRKEFLRAEPLFNHSYWRPDSIVTRHGRSEIVVLSTQTHRDNKECLSLLRLDEPWYGKIGKPFYSSKDGTIEAVAFHEVESSNDFRVIVADSYDVFGWNPQNNSTKLLLNSCVPHYKRFESAGEGGGVIAYSSFNGNNAIQYIENPFDKWESKEIANLNGKELVDIAVQHQSISGMFVYATSDHKIYTAQARDELLDAFIHRGLGTPGHLLAENRGAPEHLLISGMMEQTVLDVLFSNGEIHEVESSVSHDNYAHYAAESYGINLETYGVNSKGYDYISGENSVWNPFNKVCYCKIYNHGQCAVAADDPSPNRRYVIWRGNYDLDIDNSLVGQAANVFYRQPDGSTGFYGTGVEICAYRKQSILTRDCGSRVLHNIDVSKPWGTRPNGTWHDHYMPHSPVNFDDAKMPEITVLLVSKVDKKSKHYPDIKRGDKIIEAKERTWWMSRWTGATGKGNNLEYHETILFFKINDSNSSNSYGDRWHVWDSPKGMKIGGWGNVINENRYKDIKIF